MENIQEFLSMAVGVGIFAFVLYKIFTTFNK